MYIICSMHLIFHQMDCVNCQCLVQFADNTAHWSLFKDLRNLRVPESDDLCVICRSSKATHDNEIVLCHTCDRGYHQNCMQVSHIPSELHAGITYSIRTACRYHIYHQNCMQVSHNSSEPNTGITYTVRTACRYHIYHQNCMQVSHNPS